MDFCGKGVNEVFELLKTSEQGLSNSEVEERLKKFGHNILVEKKKESLFHKFLMQFTDMLVIILIIAAVISFFLGEYTDGSVILFIVVLNAFIGFFQEFKAERALEALKAMIHPVAVVMRGGQKKEISVGDLVPGDIIVLEEGAKIPADARVFDVAELRCDEAILTGESTPQHKSVDAIEGVYISPADMDNMVFMGTAVTHGRGRAIVVNTGMKTEFGKIAGLTANIEEEKSPLKKELFNVGKFIAKATLVTCLLIFLFGLISGNGLFEMFMFAVSLAVAAVPEGLPATVTIALALGVQRMAKKKAIIRKLASVETLGSTTVICSDKTGTITKNEMTVTEVFVDDTVISVAGSGYIPEGDFSSESHNLSYLLQASVLCNDSSLNRSDDDVWKVLGDPTEGALVVAALKKGLNVDSLRDSYKRIFEIPFDSSRKMMTTINESAEQKTAFVKGAPDFILSNCSKININGEIVDMSSEMRDKISNQNIKMAGNALRVLGFAYRDCSGWQEFSAVENNLIFLGLVGMIDPPRPEVADAVKICKQAGIRIIVITGDFGITAKAIAEKLGIANSDTKVITGIELNNISDNNLKKELDNNVIFARVSPEHKLRIVSLFRDKGEVVAVTGDGVNDAPALKRADIGVAMGITGTDVSKEASDMVLLDDSFATIVSAVYEGRSIYDDIKKFLRYIFSSNLGELSTVILSMLFFPGFLMISAIQILWINLVTDVLPALALGVEPPESDIMQRPPRKSSERMMNKKSFFDWLVTGILISIGVILIFAFNKSDLARAGTMAFCLLMMFQMVNVFNCRAEKKSLFQLGFFSNIKLIGAIGLSLVFQLLVVYIPFLQRIFNTSSLAFFDWLIVVGVALLIFVYDELKKLVFRLVKKSRLRTVVSSV